MAAPGHSVRFLAFAFASADLLLEADDAGKVVFALGAVQPLGLDDTAQITGKSVQDLLAPCDASLVAHLLETLGTGQRFGPIALKGVTAEGTKQIMLSGCRFPDRPEVLSLAISFEVKNGPAAVTARRDEQTGLVERNDFENVAREALRSAREAGQDIKLSLLSFAGQEEFASRVDSTVAETFLAQTGALLRAESFGDAATRQDDGKYALLHDGDMAIESISERIAEISRALDPASEGIKVEGGSIEVDAQMSARDAASALVFAVNRFAADDGDSFEPQKLGTSLETLMKETGAKMAHFRSALAQGRLSYMKQPIVDLKTRAIHHHELLVRFDKNESPFEMVCFAEETGLVMELDEIVMSRAIAYLSKTEADDNSALAVNVSGRSLSSMKFMGNLYSALTKIHFARSRLMLEITESSIIENLDEADRVIQKIRKLGHHVCLDDFGAGAASFQYLRALTVDYVKIDGAYIRTALKQRREAMMLKAIAGLAHDLGIRTIAESIETKEQSAMLLKLGVDQGQGYLFGRPAALDRPGGDEKAA